MARCAYCNSLLLFGGRKVGTYTFCNAKCQQGAHYLAIAQQIPEQTLLQAIQQLDQSGCPKCKGAGPVEVHTSHMVWSALVLTSWSSQPAVSCRSCGVKSQVGKAALSAVVGWWGFPWGLIMTPVQIGRNVVGYVLEAGTSLAATQAHHRPAHGSADRRAAAVAAATKSATYTRVWDAAAI